MKWTTKDGVTKDIRELKTSHLENIIRLLKKRNGTYMTYGGGTDAEDMWFDEELVNLDEDIEKIELELRLRKIEEKL